jgi:hypothetical protein
MSSPKMKKFYNRYEGLIVPPVCPNKSELWLGYHRLPAMNIV